MVITVQGTEKDNNNSAAVAGTIAAMAVIRNKKKTLVLQCMDKTGNNVENALAGRKLSNELLGSSFDATDIGSGIDALMIHAAGSKINGEIFTQCTRHMVESETKNMFDVARSSGRDDFEADFILKEEEYQNLFRDAGAVYDLVIVVVPSANTGLAAALTSLSDVNIVCIGQRHAEKYTKGKKDILVEVDFEDGSIFSPKSVRREYGVKALYGIPHCVGFNDAVADGTLLRFIYKNCLNDKKDSNVDFSYNVGLLLDAIFGKNKEEDPFGFPDMELPIKAPEGRDMMARTGINAEDLVEHEVKAGLFKKRTVAALGKGE